MDWDSTPGCCSLKQYGTTNREIFGWDGVKVNPERLHIVRETVRARFKELLAGEHVADPLNVFIKREPHKIAKFDEGKFRLISGVSLIDTLVDRILFGWILRAALGSVLETPCMLGWSPVRGGWRFLTKFANKPMTCMDKSSWDWTVVEWMIKALELFLIELPICPPDWWIKMVQLRIRLLYLECVYQFPDGTQVQQEGWGIQKSGCLLTLIANSVWQSILHFEACFNLDLDPFADMPITLGDDTLQRWRHSLKMLYLYAEEISKMGPTIKSVSIQHWVEFAGFLVVGNSCIPAYWKKHLYKMLYAESPVETLQQYQILYSHHTAMFEFLEKSLCAISPKFVLTRNWCRGIMDDEGFVGDFGM